MHIYWLGNFSSLFIKLINLFCFVLFCFMHWVFGVAQRLPLVVASEGYSLVAARGLLLTVAYLVAKHGI